MAQSIVDIEIAAERLANTHYKKIKAIVDLKTGTMTLPKKMVEELRLRRLGHRTFTVGRESKKGDVFGPLYVRIGKRTACVDALVRPGRPRFGVLPFSSLDLVVDKPGSKEAHLKPRVKGKIVAMAKGHKSFIG